MILEIFSVDVISILFSERAGWKRISQDARLFLNLYWRLQGPSANVRLRAILLKPHATLENTPVVILYCKVSPARRNYSKLLLWKVTFYNCVRFLM